MKRFDDRQFQARVSSALERVRTILDNTRNPLLPSDVSHEYEDKYLLADFLTNTAIVGYLTCLDKLGLSEKMLTQLKDWAKTRSVTLRLKAEEQCKFVKKATREVESDTKQVTSTVFGKKEAFTVTKVTEYFWTFDVKWELIAFVGTESEKGIEILSRNGTIELKTIFENTPKPVSVVRPPIDVNITWLLNNIEESQRPIFSIDRKSTFCHTPRRNSEIEGALTFFSSFYNWSDNVHSYFTKQLFPVHSDHGLDLSAIQDSSIFVPVLPLFEKPKQSSDYASSSSSSAPSVLPSAFMSSFLREQARSIDEKLKDLSSVFPLNEKVVTYAEAKLLVLLLHSKRIGESHSEGVDYIEDMLHKQLVAAIGKEVTPVDFTNYLNFHNRKFFKGEYQPRAFCYAIRRPEHYPEGTLSIEASLDDGGIPNPINTIVAHNPASHPMFFSINASTKVAFNGDRYLHGWVSHQFSGYSGSTTSLVARARQFSSFILLVGRIASAKLFEPKYGIIIQNKDELKIPLMLEVIPTPKEFKDAIESLSPEQQRFCKAFRSMQLESTLFAVCVIQIKPQLEKLLKLPDDSLTKEIQLTQDLLELFIKYQIPSDLISYDGVVNASVDGKLSTVKGYVSNMQAMIKKAKETELVDAKEAQSYRKAETDMQLFDMSSVVQEQSLYLAEGVSLKKKSSSSPFSRSSAISMSRSAVTPAPMHALSRPPSSAPPIQAYSAAPPAAPPAQAAPAQAPSPAKPPPSKAKVDSMREVNEDLDVVDYTTIPTTMEAKFEALDEDDALHPTIINPGNSWTKRYQKALLADPATTTLGTEEQEQERNKTFDLLDALTKSGALSIDQASLHVLVATTHCFDKTLMRTIIQDNINPIEKVEYSSLIVASTIHNTSPAELIAPQHLDRLTNSSPLLFESPKASIVELISTTSEASSAVSNNNNVKTE